MTYCVAIKTDSGLVFASDSLTNAGIDHVSTYSKMHTFVHARERMFVLLAAGNLATMQSVVKCLRERLQLAHEPHYHDLRQYCSCGARAPRPSCWDCASRPSSLKAMRDCLTQRSYARMLLERSW